MGDSQLRVLAARKSSLGSARVSRPRRLPDRRSPVSLHYFNPGNRETCGQSGGGVGRPAPSGGFESWGRFATGCNQRSAHCFQANSRAQLGIEMGDSQLRVLAARKSSLGSARVSRPRRLPDRRSPVSRTTSTQGIVRPAVNAAAGSGDPRRAERGLHPLQTCPTFDSPIKSTVSETRAEGVKACRSLCPTPPGGKFRAASETNPRVRCLLFWVIRFVV